MVNMPAVALLAYAFQKPLTEIKGIPSWARTERYTVQAKSENDKASGDDFRAMTRALLTTRFHLAVHEEETLTNVYVLSSATKGGTLGPQLKAQATPCKAGEIVTPRPPSPAAGRPRPCPGLSFGPTFIEGSAPMSLLASMLSGRVLSGVRVLDRTGLEGVYDLLVQFSNTSPDVVGDASSHPSLPNALQEQLGLKLELTREPVRVVVVDRLERPTPD
jgi:uncharacterized protein (TIGR03435 family)